MEQKKVISLDEARDNKQQHELTSSAENTFAAIDLGSNSFHLTIASFEKNQLKIIDSFKHRIQLAAGLDKNNYLSQEKITEAFQCLEFYALKLNRLKPGNIRVLATHTLRKAKNADELLNPVNEIFNYPIEIISGVEEARIIFEGVARYESSHNKLLVIDIGGGSTEFAIGKGTLTFLLDSIQMGCVTFTREYFPEKKITESAFEAAQTAAQLALLPVVNHYNREGWETCFGTSGTIESIYQSLLQRKMIQTTMSLQALEQLKEEFIHANSFDNLKLCPINESRRDIIVAGLAILIATFKSLKIEKLSFSKAALREGILYELYYHDSYNERREVGIENIISRFHLDVNQSRRVALTATKLFGLLPESENIENKKWLNLLVWAARIHEIGLILNFNQHQKHGEYIVKAIELPGFNETEKQILALLIRTSIKDFPSQKFSEISNESERGEILRLARLLRLTVILNHLRKDDIVLPQRLQFQNNSGMDSYQDIMILNFPDGYLAGMPLLTAELELEKYHLAKTGFGLRFK